MKNIARLGPKEFDREQLAESTFLFFQFDYPITASKLDVLEHFIVDR
jgi:hypothetical protein